MLLRKRDKGRVRANSASGHAYRTRFRWRSRLERNGFIQMNKKNRMYSYSSSYRVELLPLHDTVKGLDTSGQFYFSTAGFAVTTITARCE